jgi:hypothetical protein
MTFRKSKIVVTSIVAMVVQFLVPQLVPIAKATAPSFTELMVRLDRMAELTATGGTVCAKTPASGVGSEAKVVVQFPHQPVNTDFVMDSTAADWTVTTTNLPVDPSGGGAATAWPGITAPSGPGSFGTRTVTFASGALSASTFYCFNFEPTNPATPILTTSSKYDNTISGEKSLVGFVTSETAGNAVIDQTEYAVDIVGNDQITVTAVVPPIFTMDLSGNVDPFQSDLSTSSTIYTSGITASITTNAPNGWVTWVHGTNAGLKSTLAGGYIIPTVTSSGSPANVALATDTQQYGAYGTVTNAPVGSCTPAIKAVYDPHISTVPTTIGTLATTFQTFADCTGTSPATADNTQIMITEGANIDAHAPAGSDYTDVITIVGAGNF